MQLTERLLVAGHAPCLAVAIVTATTRFLLPAIATLTLFAGLSRDAFAQDAAQTFRASCASCHTIGGGRLVGPDLKGSHERRERDWLKRFIANPKAVIDAGDATAAQLVQESRGVVMPTLGIAPEVIDALIDLIAAESALPRSQFIGAAAAGGAGPRPMTDADVALGRKLFMGSKLLAKRGPSCISCHQVRGVGALGGGRLGPDLTGVYARLGGQAALTSWLGSPASATMKPVFEGRPITPDEAHALASYLKVAGARGGSAAPSMVSFVLLGLLGMAVGLVVLDLAWNKRFRAVRRPLVRGDK
jgi:mono/diheme cytochrome c family protein